MRMEMEEKEGSNEESREVKEIRRSKKWDEKKRRLRFRLSSFKSKP